MKSDILDQLTAALHTRQREILDISHFIHEHPETRFEEYESSRYLQRVLNQAGFRVTSAAGGFQTAFVAKVGSPSGPVFALMAEYDALPDIGHACGHNLIAAMSTGAALLVHDLWQNLSLHGELWVIGTPGEEGGGGKIRLLDAGVFDGVTKAAMLHPGSVNNADPLMLSREGLDVTFVGQASHAAAAPEAGRDALGAAVAFLTVVNAMRTTLRPDANIYAIIAEGGSSPNIIADRCRVRMQIRAQDDDYLRQLVERVQRASDGVASAMQTRVHWERFVPAYNALNTDTTLAGWLEDAYRHLGRPIGDSGRSGGSTDAGNVSQRIPTLHGDIDIGPVPGHSEQFREAAGGPSGDQAALDGAWSLAYVAIQDLSSPA